LSHFVFPFLFIIGHEMFGAAGGQESPVAAPYARGKSQSQWQRCCGGAAKSQEYRGAPTAVDLQAVPTLAAAQQRAAPLSLAGGDERNHS
jgi:hypothetical protein